jgi:hypothetical protein
VYEVSSQTNSWAAWINGILLDQNGSNTVGFSTAPLLGAAPYYIANYGYSASFFAGDMAEVLVFNRTLTASERITVNSYLNGKYALVSAVPPTPTNLMAMAISTSQVSLTWNEVLTNGGATQISIERKTGSGGTYAVVAQIANALSYLDTNLTSGTTYYYRVRAINLTTWSPYSNETNATTLASGPDVPLGNLLLWLKADTGLLQASTNTLVSYWADQSGKGNHAYQSSSANQPVWVPAAVGNRPIVRFNGTNSYFNLPNFLTGATGAEAFVILKVATNPPPSFQSLWEMGGDSFYHKTYPDTDGSIKDDFGSTVTQPEGVPAQPLTQYHVYEVSSQTNSWAAWINGILLDQNGSNTVGFSTAPLLGAAPYYIGNYGYSASFFAGDMAEVLVFNRTLTVDEKTTVGTYLINKYSLSQFALNNSAPNAPTNLIATGVSPFQLNLQWHSTSTNETGFAIERKVGAGGSYQEIGGTTSGITNFSDSTVFYTNQYFYKIKAENYFGQSGYSTEISPPVVSLTLLSTNAYIMVGSTNLLIVQAVDADSSINRLAIANTFQMNTVIGTSTPYTNTWLPIIQKTYSLTATASDAAGNSWFSPPLSTPVYLDSNGDGIPDYLQVLQGNNPLNPWTPPGFSTNTPIITLLIPTNAVIVP